jgi:ankyrin repeat protein
LDAKLDDLKMLKILIDYGLYLNQKDYKVLIPLYIAAINKQKKIYTYLLSKGGNIYLKFKEGFSPLDATGSPEMKSYLSEFISQPFSNPLYKEKIKKFLLEQKNQKKRMKKKKKRK